MIKVALLLALVAFANADKIVGGTKASQGQFKYIVNLRTRTGFQYCGGSIYSSTWIVTAAHCQVASNDYIVAGDLNKNDNSGKEQSRSLSRIVNHAQYSSSTTANDVAVVQLSSSLTFNTNVAAISLASSTVANGAAVTISGWGTTSYGGSSSADLLYATVYKQTHNYCTNAYGSIRIKSGMICIGVQSGGVDSCQGDSGGPAAVGNTLVGITSWGISCADAQYPGVYTDVAYFRSWIVNNAK